MKWRDTLLLKQDWAPNPDYQKLNFWDIAIHQSSFGSNLIPSLLYCSASLPPQEWVGEIPGSKKPNLNHFFTTLIDNTVFLWIYTHPISFFNRRWWLQICIVSWSRSVVLCWPSISWSGFCCRQCPVLLIIWRLLEKSQTRMCTVPKIYHRHVTNRSSTIKIILTIIKRYVIYGTV